MEKLDYIVVGLGLAGMAFCEQLEAHGLNFIVIDSGGVAASRVSGGMYNPVILKRYTLPWEAEKFMDSAVPYYRNLMEKLQIQAMQALPVLRLFNAAEDQNNWFEALDKPGLKRFLSPQLLKQPIAGIRAPFHFGKVKETGRIDVPQVLNAYKAHIKKNDQWLPESMVHDQLQFEENGVIYKDLKARMVVFAEGYGVKENPFFSKLPLVGNKGEYIIIKAENLQLNAAVKSQFFIIPQGNHLYKVGATFNWREKDNQPTAEARREILGKLQQVLTCDFEVVGQEAGMRPTTGDRRPLLGRHPHFENLALFNGLGTRGIMMSPYLAELLFDYLENGKKLPKTVDIMRFPKKFDKKMNNEK